MDSSEYHEFHSGTEAEAWAWEHYGNLLRMSPESQLYKDIFAYTGNLFTSINRIMRTIPPYGTPEFSEYDPGDFQWAYEAIPRIADTLNGYETPEGIVVYRFTHLKIVRNLCKKWRLRHGLIFSDKSFLSTTLLREQLVEFGKVHGCNCVLKFYLPKGTHGAYVSLKNKWDLLSEYEFLLPPNMKFEIVKVCRLTSPIMIECIAL